MQSIASARFIPELNMTDLEIFNLAEAKKMRLERKKRKAPYDIVYKTKEYMIWYWHDEQQLRFARREYYDGPTYEVFAVYYYQNGAFWTDNRDELIKLMQWLTTPTQRRHW